MCLKVRAANFIGQVQSLHNTARPPAQEKGVFFFFPVNVSFLIFLTPFEGLRGDGVASFESFEENCLALQIKFD